MRLESRLAKLEEQLPPLPKEIPDTALGIILAMQAGTLTMGDLPAETRAELLSALGREIARRRASPSVASFLGVNSRVNSD